MSGFNHMLQRALWSNAKVASEDGCSRLIYDLYLPAQLILEPSPQGELRPAVSVGPIQWPHCEAVINIKPTCDTILHAYNYVIK